jgi:hypothetical protein
MALSYLMLAITLAQLGESFEQIDTLGSETGCVLGHAELAGGIHDDVVLDMSGNLLLVAADDGTKSYCPMPRGCCGAEVQLIYILIVCIHYGM